MSEPSATQIVHVRSTANPFGSLVVAIMRVELPPGIIPVTQSGAFSKTKKLLSASATGYAGSLRALACHS